MFENSFVALCLEQCRKNATICLKKNIVCWELVLTRDVKNVCFDEIKCQHDMFEIKATAFNELGLKRQQ
jgi:hypothetical protein